MDTWWTFPGRGKGVHTIAPVVTVGTRSKLPFQAMKPADICGETTAMNGVRATYVFSNLACNGMYY
ncbi:hypothetical protein, partial [Acidisphaera sp. L21]|uniref:hypothetical protein n=1 Tax=Acidisphaera sp. L21 TaxID=1641851 RepID=UPI001C2057CD